ncbi:MAG: cysteine desulfurase-like protein [Anaerolineae bacterium]|nr:cysteine desulfurase-like protein [Anaerolineae bacterium]
MPSFDANAVRTRFPSLSIPVASGELPVFFDNPAGTQVPSSVIDAVRDYYTHMNANSGGAFATSRASDAMVAQTRALAATFLNAARPEEIAFGPNMTTLNFALSRALGSTLAAGDEIVVTRMDHDANVAPWLRLADDHGLTVRWVDIRTEDCTLDLDSLEAALTERTRIVATVHASNAAGTINPVARIAEMVHAAGALHVVDAVQSAPHLLLDVQAIGCDFLLCSSYKFFGPHAGLLWSRYELSESLPAYKVRPAKDKSPYRWETGTPAFELIAGVGAALRYLASLSGESEPTRTAFEKAFTAMRAYENELVTHLIDMLKTIPHVYIAGITDAARFSDRVPTVIFAHERLAPLAIAEHLAKHHIYVWDGNYYALEIMERLGRGDDGMVRVGLAHYNTHDEIDRLEAALRKL